MGHNPRGAVYSDGNDVNVTLCGDAIMNNAAGANAFGGGLFFTSNNYGGRLTIADTTMTGNTGGHWTHVQSGAVKNAGTAVGTNAKSHHHQLDDPGGGWGAVAARRPFGLRVHGEIENMFRP